MSTYTNLKDAYEEEIKALRHYKQWAAAAQDPAIREMFLQFGKNESWHAAALREKIQMFEKDGREE